MDEQTKIIDELIKISKIQSESINDLSAGFNTMGDQIEERPTNKKVKRLGLIVAAVLVVVFSLALFFTYQSSNKTLDTISGCLDPTEECAKQQAEASRIIRGQIICNQEKVLYLVYGAEGLYDPLPLCGELINSEIDRLEELDEVPEGVEKVDIDPNVEQIPAFKEEFLAPPSS